MEQENAAHYAVYGRALGRAGLAPEYLDQLLPPAAADPFHVRESVIGDGRVRRPGKRHRETSLERAVASLIVLTFCRGH